MFGIALGVSGLTRRVGKRGSKVRTSYRRLLRNSKLHESRWSLAAPRARRATYGLRKRSAATAKRVERVRMWSRVRLRSPRRRLKGASMDTMDTMDGARSRDPECVKFQFKVTNSRFEVPKKAIDRKSTRLNSSH